MMKHGPRTRATKQSHQLGRKQLGGTENGTMSRDWHPFIAGTITSSIAWYLWGVNPWVSHFEHDHNLALLNLLLNYIGALFGYFGFLLIAKSKSDKAWTNQEILIGIFASFFCMWGPTILDIAFPKT